VQGNNVGDDESEDIMKTTIDMAREDKVTPDLVTADGLFFTRIEHLVAFVAAAEREACAKLIESRKTGVNELMDAVRDVEARAIRARR
jgi:hypothetical protein